MITVEQAARDYGVTVERVKDAVFTVKEFILTPLSTACVLWFRIKESGGKGIPGVRVMVINGGETLSNPSKENGETDVGMGGGSAYFPKEGQSGPHSAWISGATSDIVHGLGWDGSTDHQSLITIWEGEGGMTEDYELIDFGELNLYDHFREAGVEVNKEVKYGVTQLIGTSGSDEPFPLEVQVKNAKGKPAIGVLIKVKRDGGEGGVWDYFTDANGYAVIYMDEGWKYPVPSMPSYCIHVGQGYGNSDIVKVGWVQNQKRWFNVVFQERGSALPEKPILSDLLVSNDYASVKYKSENATALGYTLDGPDYHKDGEVIPGEGLLTMQNLQPATAYVLKAWGINEYGDSPDEFLEFETLEEQGVPESVQNLQITDKSAHSLVLEWESDAYTFKIESPGGVFQIQDRIFISANLLEETPYNYIVYAGNEVGWSTGVEIWGETLPETTGECLCHDDLVTIGRKLDTIIDELKRIEGGCTCHQ